MQKVINKLLKDIHQETLKKNFKKCIELYNCVGGSYSEIGEYSSAIEYHEKALEAAKTCGDLQSLDTAITYRSIGEARAALGEFYSAIEDIKNYLRLAQKSGDKVEIQRAWTTLGRVYLMQAQEMKDNGLVIDDGVKEVANKAEKYFQNALSLTKSVKGQVDEKEYAQMRSGLLVNIGLIKDICGEYKECVPKFVEAIEICDKAKIKEDLFRCQNILSSIYRQKYDLKSAARVSEEALKTAKSKGLKILICEAYIERGLVRLWQRDFKDAKRNFVQAYFEKSPNEDDHLKAIRLAKLSHLICMKYQQLSQDSVPSEVRLKLFDKLGDLFVAVNCFKLAIEFYREALTNAKICNKPKNELARILYSIAETYADDGQYSHAKLCYEKEIKLRNGNPEEQCQSYIKIAHMDEYLKREPEETCNSYEKALEKAGKDDKLVYNVLKDYVAYLQRRSYNHSRMEALEKRLTHIRELFPDVIESVEIDGEEADDIEDEAGNIDDIISDDEDNEETLTVGRRKIRGNKFKRNEVGDTPLHKACIEGQLERVKSLISQGHEVNPRDNAGWIPLHEACNLGHYAIVDYLIEHGGDVNNRGLGGMSPLHDAAINGHYEVMRLLIKHGANVIALTDQGETVLNCLRDYKKRQDTSKMRNSELVEYKQMEAELLNIMDRRGYNLMEQNMKQLQGTSTSARRNTSGRVKEALTHERPTTSSTLVSPNPKTIMNQVDQNAAKVTNSVKDYKNLMGSLKRKRLINDDKESDDRCKKGNLPTTYHTDTNPSAPTKEWLIDDVSREQQIIKRRSYLCDALKDIDEVEYTQGEEEAITFSSNIQSVADDDDDDDEIVTIGSSKSKRRNSPPQIESDSSSSHIAKTISIDDEDEFDMIDKIPSPTGNAATIASPDHSIQIASPCNSLPAQIPSPRLAPQDETSNLLNNLDSSNNSWGHISTVSNLKCVIIQVDVKRYAVPIRDINTIGDLKKSLSERYQTLNNVKPQNITLTPANDPNRVLFDTDPCRDVVHGDLVASFGSFLLDSMQKVYADNCAILNIEPLDFIRTELKLIEQKNHLLDLSYTRFPRAHLKPMFQALSYRHFTNVDITGATCLLESPGSHGLDLMDTIGTWKKLTHITMKCVGLKRVHFETICTKIQLGQLKHLDISFNAIFFKCHLEFDKQIKSLRANCPNLKKLDLRQNYLQTQEKRSDEAFGDLEILLSDQINHYVAAL